MIIAVNTRLRKETQPDGFEDFLIGSVNCLAEKYPQHQFICISDKAFPENLVFKKNMQPVITGPKTTNNLRLQYWFNFRIPAVLRKYKADVFLSLDGICSLRTKKPQCLLITDLGFLNAQPKNAVDKFYKKNMPAFINRAKSIAAVSEYSKSQVVEHYKINADQVDVIEPGIDEIFAPAKWEEREIIKEKYTGGKEYFLFSGDVNKQSNLINLLKAFSFFKKRQKSNMMLLIAGTTDEQFKKELKTYRLRAEVMVLENLTKAELAKITASAYALVYPVLYAGFAIPVLSALQCEVPVITANTGALPSIFGKAALYVNPGDFKDIAENMMLVFKDEDKAKELVKAGKELALQYQWNKTAGLLMQTILKAFTN